MKIRARVRRTAKGVESVYKISFEIAAFILTLVCLVYSLTVKRRQYKVRGSLAAKLQNQHFVFLLLLLSNLFASAASVSGGFLQEIASARVVFWQYLLHALYFIFHSTLSICFALYIMNVNGTSIGRSKRFYILFALPYCVAELLVLTNHFTGLAFYMDEQFVYHRGPLMIVLYGIGAFYIILGFAFFVRYNQAISRVDRNAIAAVIVMASLGIVLQALRPDLLVELFSEALAFLMLMVLLEERRGHIDSLTGTLNRLALADANRRLIQTGQHYSLVPVKLNNLELYSRLFDGREMERLLRQISAWLISVSSDEDLFSYGRGEFAVILADAPPEAAEALAQRIVERFEKKWTSGEMTLRLDATVAVIRVPEQAASQEQLEEMLAAVYQNQEAGTRLLHPDELDSYRRSLNMEQAMRRAIEDGKLRVWYQPIWSVQEQRTVAAEALLRIDDEEFRGISPEVYIPIAEKSGLIRQIGMFVFTDVCRFLNGHPEEADGLQYIELNLSIYQFMYDDLAERFEEIRSRIGVAAPRINIEITETAPDQAVSGVAEGLERLRARGYTFSLDDFGSGYSNLNRLVKGDYVNVKIDKALLWEADSNPEACRLLDSLTHIIRSLGYNVIQEGVETAQQLRHVSEAGCSLIQGYFFSKPLPEAAFLDYLRRERQKGKITIDRAISR